MIKWTKSPINLSVSSWQRLEISHIKGPNPGKILGETPAVREIPMWWTYIFTIWTMSKRQIHLRELQSPSPQWALTQSMRGSTRTAGINSSAIQIFKRGIDLRQPKRSTLSSRTKQEGCTPTIVLVLRIPNSPKIPPEVIKVMLRITSLALLDRTIQMRLWNNPYRSGDLIHRRREKERFGAQFPSRTPFTSRSVSTRTAFRSWRSCRCLSGCTSSRSWRSAPSLQMLQRILPRNPWERVSWANLRGRLKGIK